MKKYLIAAVLVAALGGISATLTAAPKKPAPKKSARAASSAKPSGGKSARAASSAKPARGKSARAASSAKGAKSARAASRGGRGGGGTSARAAGRGRAARTEILEGATVEDGALVLGGRQESLDKIGTSINAEMIRNEERQKVMYEMSKLSTAEAKTKLNDDISKRRDEIQKVVNDIDTAKAELVATRNRKSVYEQKKVIREAISKVLADQGIDDYASIDAAIQSAYVEAGLN
jgi:hypothetical protein